jgi:dihydroxyacid dehydratase/phosphogluconate dehydratase
MQWVKLKKMYAKPFVGVVSTWNEAAPCNIALMRQAQSVKKGVRAKVEHQENFVRLQLQMELQWVMKE